MNSDKLEDDRTKTHTTPHCFDQQHKNKNKLHTYIRASSASSTTPHLRPLPLPPPLPLGKERPKRTTHTSTVHCGRGGGTFARRLHLKHQRNRLDTSPAAIRSQRHARARATLTFSRGSTKARRLNVCASYRAWIGYSRWMPHSSCPSWGEERF